MDCGAKRMKATEKDEGTAERMIQGEKISLLPESLIHHIMSLLPTRYVARASVLSHKWGAFWSTFPFINVSSSDFPYRHATQEAFRQDKLRYLKCLRQTLAHSSLNYLDMLSIKPMTFRNDEYYELVDRLVEGSMEGKLKNLDLNLLSNVINHAPNGPDGCQRCYSVPKVVFSLGESLLSLNLHGCNLVGYNQNHSVNFCLLKKLTITHTHVQAAFLEKVVGGSLALESLELSMCFGLKSFRIAHKQMKKFVLGQFKDMDECKVDALGLQQFEYSGCCSLQDAEQIHWDILEFNLRDAFMFPSLTYLSLKYVNTDAGTFNRIVSSFPKLKAIHMKECDISGSCHLLGNELIHVLIEECDFEEKMECRAGNLETATFRFSTNIFTINEIFKYLGSVSFIGIEELTGSDIQLAVDSCPLLHSLEIESCSDLESIEILSSSLESLSITYCVNVQEVRILAHNLKFLKYTGPLLKFSGLVASAVLVSELEVNCNTETHKDPAQFQLAQFVEMFRHCGCNYSIKLTSTCDECMDMVRRRL